jgi:hypothetical protein
MRLKSELESLEFLCKRTGINLEFNFASFVPAVEKESFKTGEISLINDYQCDRGI